jgi:hypothetical protein
MQAEQILSYPAKQWVTEKDFGQIIYIKPTVSGP